MPLILNKQDNNKWIDLTDVLVQVPKTNLEITDYVGFQDTYSSQKSIEIRRTKNKNIILTDRNWDERHNVTVGGARDSLQLAIPHFPADDGITVNDVDGVVQVNSIQEAQALESVGAVRQEKMSRLQDAHALTKAVARMQLITTGTVYAPTGTLRQTYGPTVNFYTEFGVTRTEIGVNLASGIDPRAQVEEVIKSVRNAARNGGQYRRIVAFCSTSFFNALWTNAYVTDAVKYFQQAQSLAILTGRPEAAAGLDSRYRSLDLWGVLWIDAGEAGYEDASGTFVPMIPEGDAYVFPYGLRDLFKTYYAPAQKFSTINRTAQGSYWFEYANEKDEIIEIESEQNFMNATLYPGAIQRLYLDS